MLLLRELDELSEKREAEFELEIRNLEHCS